MRFSYCMLPDYPLDDCIEIIKTADELGFYAAYSVDETWHKDLWVLFAAAAREDEADPLRPERHARVPARADAHLPADGDAGRADRRPHRDRRLHRQLRAAVAVQDRLGEPEAALAPEGGHPRDAHLPVRGRDHLRRRLLPVQRAVHVRQARPGGRDPDQDGRDEGPALVPHRGRDRRRHAPGARLLTRGLRLLVRAAEGGRGARPAATTRASTTAPGW